MSNAVPIRPEKPRESVTHKEILDTFEHKLDDFSRDMKAHEKDRDVFRKESAVFQAKVFEELEKVSKELHKATVAVNHISTEFSTLMKYMGKEPNSDGSNGEGFIGDMRKMAVDVKALVVFRKVFWAVVVVIGIISPLVIAGLVYFVDRIARGQDVLG